MIEIRRTAFFDIWLNGMRDIAGKARIIKRLERAQQGNLGDIAPVGEGVMEMRLFFGPGYRIYFVQRGDTLVILLCGGDKSSQPNDIERAKAMAKEIE
ncbi:type II toxin-antitoxin system RelE/ParE family toxin [Sphingobium sp. D43FB]|uniref:type II toxin-antitoxin system RelE/ParE family toxin n=1 Tax=Sphingobium sp. D43FB TaxID=2017595 RepID=UPI000BB578EE|nr:type II toxin-antitoxin system RelE/ParE family toxin [Sphingobium sp. D43FB]PBN44714.1 addiction module antitoxin RelB [Sphingobium sp. D43FB]